MSAALSSLQTNSAALRVVANNVSNVNTPNYARRIIDLQTLASGGQLSGVGVADIQRVVDQFLNQETLSANASATRYSTQTSAFDQINALLGTPGDGSALTSKLSAVYAALGQAALSPTSGSSQSSVVNALQNFASGVSSLSGSLASLQSQTDAQVASTVSQANALIKQVYDYNQQIKTAYVNGDTASALLDQRDTALQNLSKLVDVQTVTRQDGSMLVTTPDGITLAGDTYAQLTYTASNDNGVYQPVTVQAVDPTSGKPVGQPQSFDPHVTGGQLKGLLDVRDSILPDLQNELGTFAQGVTQSFNAQHNASTAYPPPTTLDGRDTGLLAGDALNFTGKTTIAVTDSSGTLVKRIDVDFSNNQISTDGGSTWTAFTSTVGGFTTALNSALGTSGSASFADGQLTLAATGTNGVVVQDDASTPSSRGGAGFSQFFGLNDLFQSSGPSLLTTGLASSDASGLAAGTAINLQLKSADGAIVKQGTVSITAGMTIGDVVNALNTAMGGTMAFTLGANGAITTAASSSYQDCRLQVASDTTERGTTGISFTDLFGIGDNQLARQSANFSVVPEITNDPSRLATAHADFSTTQIVGSGDSNGLLALQNLATAHYSFAAVGDLTKQSISLGDFAGAFYQDVASRAGAAQTNQTAQSDRQTEAQARQSTESGVNLDEELSNMMIYQRAYGAGARMLSVVDQLYQTLLQIQ